ncbi:bifunctional UDP-N-acetylglucosamine diphosphorylase/glucosamine-1-phosphate N-acetyltransferase GlmU [Campylobacter sp. VicNov18]|uniref:bifunctional UDP-N-acetylglucosamine diphosphorylase/glucosamine-1-phosphate N-acetyltransferase GlmU n=1 Tax=Campylobacter bilis TaxID=2691918 RepID=UPI00130DC233|nr:bifunctional UDP-N-acetylglucosamine diphosphorylase/glucosamine-1-phosphate N-acetyltransferase GlmU [Campylobacter bilis]MPV63571.1 bifunctional UDP-N-acetylglucosamine diphosphorylase/glucosamine-1-phosphate N-acetyltransferase GlmU [Campylobacter hepaticus]MBM0637071.1 bifunctional UDP-N-acetylglucosamine diphosphorylase/glucosamine-1-phosphate N-acetyltransferase GlmU [Campylobacter bilis]MCC8277771.1 bifunctional UDP-N-acetylglucosamine diphosphorylase/glucosamine-1-phosphate N-acetyltr
MKASILILAAGFGTRMKSQKPKVLQELCQKSMILHILKKAFANSNDVSVVLSHQKERIEKEILKHFPKTQIIEQDLQNYPGTAGALRDFKPKNERVLILCGDMPLVEQKSLKTLLDTQAKLALAVFKAKDAKSYGRVVIRENKVEKIVEFKDASTQEKEINTCNSGVYVVQAKLLKKLLPLIDNDNAAKEYYLTDIVKLAKKTNIDIEAVFVDEDEFMGINDKFDLSKAECLMQEKIKKYWMEQGVIFHMPYSTFIGSDVEFVGECEVYENVRIEGQSKIINSIIKSSSVIENSFVENSDIGPLAHLRPHCELKNTHIGNFVECKNAKLDSVKAGHLSYLGDCEIESGTNIGCGVITCNYDGIKKHKTFIGKNVFVGSDTQFIAPVKIEDEAIIAAGSTVNVDVKKGALFINRAGYKMVKDYYYKKFKNENHTSSR